MMAECIIRDLGSEERELSILVMHDYSVKFAKDLNKFLEDKNEKLFIKTVRLVEEDRDFPSGTVQKVIKVVSLR